MNSKLRKAIMTRTRLKNKFRKHPTADKEKAYKNQRNLCVKLTKQSKRLYYNILDTNHIADNKNLWKNIKPFFSEKQRKLSKIILLENNRILSCDEDVANIFNTYFLQDKTCTLTNVETTPQNKQENIKNRLKRESRN